MPFWVEKDIFMWICLFWPTSSKNYVYFFFQSRYLPQPLAISRGTPVEKPCSRGMRGSVRMRSHFMRNKVMTALIVQVAYGYCTLGLYLPHMHCWQMSVACWCYLTPMILVMWAGYLSQYSVWLRAGRSGYRGSIPGRGERIFPLASVSRPALGPTQLPFQWVPGVLSPAVKRGRDLTLTTYPHLVPRSCRSRRYISSPPLSRSLWWDLAESAFGASPESGDRFCVGAFSSRHEDVFYVNLRYKNVSAICKDNASINFCTVQHRKGSFLSTSTSHATLIIISISIHYLYVLHQQLKGQLQTQHKIHI
jgi:hypothetical protein